MAYNNRRISIEELENAARTPILPLEDLNSPLVVESIQLLRKEQEYLVHVRSTAGSEGISVANSHVEQLYPILNQRVIPYFIGKDVRGLEGHLFELYRYKSNYKLQGLAFWCPVAWVEFAILDMMGRITGKSIGQLLGGVKRR